MTSAAGWIGDGTGLAWLAGGAVLVLKTTAILAAAAGLAWLLRTRSAALRHLVWTAALAAALALPAVDAVLPAGARLPAVTVPAPWAAEAPPAAGGDGDPAAASPDRPAPGTAGRDAAGSLDGRAGDDRGGAAPAGEETPDAAAAAGGASRTGGGPWGWVPAAGWLAVLVWAIGAVVVLARTILGAARLARVRRRADPLDDPAWLRRAREASGALGGPSRPPVRVSPEISVPLTCGVLRPTLLLPQEALDEWPRRRTEAVLVHELAHVLRRDAATHVMARLACALYWFHPLVWRAAREAARERERACDDVVLRAGVRASRYARHLLEIARDAAPRALPGAAAAVSVARRRDLEGRVLSVLEGDAERAPPSRRTAAAALAPALALTVALAALSVEARPASPASAGADARPPAAADRGVDRGRSAPAAGEARGTQEAPDARDSAGAADVDGSLVRMLDDPDPAARAAAAGAVGELGIPGAVPGLTAALEDPSAEVRVEAARALGKIEDPEAAGALARALTSGEGRRFRKAAAWALGETEAPEAVDALAESLDRVEDRWLRKRVVRALGETRRPGAVAVLQGLLDEGDRKIRRAALEALVENDTDRARAALTAALESDDAGLRAMAARAVGGRKRD